MVTFNAITGVLVMCFAVGLYKCEVNKDGYNVNGILERLNNPVRSLDFHAKWEEDYAKWKSHAAAKGCYRCENDIITEKQEGNPAESSAEVVKTSQTDSKDQVHIRESGSEGQFAERFRRVRSMYECQKKISQMLGQKLFNVKSKIARELSAVGESVRLLYYCTKVVTFRRLDEFLSDKVIPVTPYLDFIRDSDNESYLNDTRDSTSYAVDILRKNWIDLTLERIIRLVNGHSLKIHLNQNEGRGRRRDHRMFAMMMMGFIIMASILVPMGFQFLTVLGGKSLLMAKMALIMSAINGLKKIATSNVGYGLYHAPEAFHHDPHHHGFHEKIFHIKAHEQPQSPFNVVI